MTDPEFSSAQCYGNAGEFGHAEQTIGSRQPTPNRKLPFMAWGGGHHGAGAPPPSTQRRGVGPSVLAGAPPPSVHHPDPSYVFVAGTGRGTFFSTPRKRPTTRPDRSVSLERLTKGIAVVGERERSPRVNSRDSRPDSRKARSPRQPLSPPRSSAQTPLSSSRQSSASRLAPCPPRLSLSPSQSSVASVSARTIDLNQVNPWDRGIERFTTGPFLKRQNSVSSVASECSATRSSSCRSERSQRILEESKYPRSNSLYSLGYFSPIEQLQANRVCSQSSDRWSEISRRETCASDDSQNKVPVIYRRHPRLQAMETMVTPRTAKDEADGSQADPRLYPHLTQADLTDHVERVEREKAWHVKQEVTALQAALAAADEKVMLHTQEIGALQAALAAAEEKPSKAAAGGAAAHGAGVDRVGVNGHALPAWLVGGRQLQQAEGGSSHHAGRVANEKSQSHPQEVGSSHSGRAPPICNGRLYQRLQSAQSGGSADAVITPRGVTNPPLSPCEKPPLHLPGLDATRGDADAAGSLHSTRSCQSDDSKSIHSSTCANADAAAGPRDNSKVFKWDFGLEDDD
mmetsp:Transcript_112222/g.183066  ORF Transcript_112222/g.183066 Transcript_112222/m.183066 type:complete len:572 (+) Transcript_112222:112-1827(+)